MSKLASLTGSLINRKNADNPAVRRAATGTMDKRPVRVSLRLDRERIRRLKVLADELGCTQQGLLVEALDDLLARRGAADMNRARRRPRADND